MKKQLAIASATLLLFGILGGCSAERTELSASQTPQSAYQVMGRVTAINGNEISLSVGGHGGFAPGTEGMPPERTSGADGSAESADAQGSPPAASDQPAQKDGSDTATTSGAASAASEPPEGRAETTITVTIPDSAAISSSLDGQTQSAALEDIVLGSMLQITYAADQSTVDSVVIVTGEPQKADFSQESTQTQTGTGETDAVTSATPTT